MNNKIDTPYSSNRISKEFKNLREALSLDYPIGTGSLKKTRYYLVFGAYKEIGNEIDIYKKVRIE